MANFAANNSNRRKSRGDLLKQVAKRSLSVREAYEDAKVYLTPSAVSEMSADFTDCGNTMSFAELAAECAYLDSAESFN